ncbi:MAG: CcoQ/FixQ family Cbb3-type cytochrome c oxidase assembly chaperone [Flavobacteriales bacterium]|nr:CcoQ/FixQ family Cbb3-type cytochrome c oxidase assembly chaperone [Flavobacteriales bacterium]
MLKFIKHHMDTIIGIGIYPLISFVLFFTFFVLMLIWLRKVGRSHVDHMAALPITEEFSTLEIEHNDH